MNLHGDSSFALVSRGKHPFKDSSKKFDSQSQRSCDRRHNEHLRNRLDLP